MCWVRLLACSNGLQGHCGQWDMKMLHQIELTHTMESDHSCTLYYDTICGYAKQATGSSGYEAPQLAMEKDD